MTIPQRKHQMRQSLAAKAKLVSVATDDRAYWGSHYILCRAVFRLAGRKCVSLTRFNGEMDEETRKVLIDKFVEEEARYSIYDMLRGHDLHTTGPKGRLPA